MARKHIPFVIAYDFDGTLASGNMQEYNFIPALGISPKNFWKEAKKLAKAQHADEILAYMQLMIQKSQEKHVPIRKQNFYEYGKNIELFQGVEDWFQRINEYGRQRSVAVKHYIVSSGLREMIQGTKIAKEFAQIYASGFMYNHNGVAYWPALAVNYTTKTQYLFRINKGSLEVFDNSIINKFIPDVDRPVPFTNMLFIGDGETDIPCMRLVKDKGGHSIAVYKSGTKNARKRASDLVKDGRATVATVANYSEDSDIDKAVKAMIDKVNAQRVISESCIPIKDDD